jgi:branched-subunit amino acid ABC-type transport system permease component
MKLYWGLLFGWRRSLALPGEYVTMGRGVLLKVFVGAAVAGYRLFNGAHVAGKILGFSIFNHGFFYKRPRHIFLIGKY